MTRSLLFVMPCAESKIDLIHARVIWEEGNTAKKNSWLIMDMGGPSSVWVV